jgi:hypothetical protein
MKDTSAGVDLGIRLFYGKPVQIMPGFRLAAGTVGVRKTISPTNKTPGPEIEHEKRPPQLSFRDWEQAEILADYYNVSFTASLSVFFVLGHLKASLGIKPWYTYNLGGKSPALGIDATLTFGNFGTKKKGNVLALDSYTEEEDSVRDMHISRFVRQNSWGLKTGAGYFSQQKSSGEDVIRTLIPFELSLYLLLKHKLHAGINASMYVSPSESDSQTTDYQYIFLGLELGYKLGHDFFSVTPLLGIGTGRYFEPQQLHDKSVIPIYYLRPAVDINFRFKQVFGITITPSYLFSIDSMISGWGINASFHLGKFDTQRKQK